MLDLNELLINILVEYLFIRVLIFSINYINYILYVFFSPNYIYNMFDIDNGIMLVLVLYTVMIIICLIEFCVSNCDADENPMN